MTVIVPPMRIGKRYDVHYCLDCGFQVSPLKLCNCPPPPPQSSAQDGAAADDLAKRVRDAQKVR